MVSLKPFVVGRAFGKGSLSLCSREEEIEPPPILLAFRMGEPQPLLLQLLWRTLPRFLALYLNVCRLYQLYFGEPFGNCFLLRNSDKHMVLRNPVFSMSPVEFWTWIERLTRSKECWDDKIVIWAFSGTSHPSLVNARSKKIFKQLSLEIQMISLLF